ncbi:hypothetical protein CYMTET_12256 [Cymbomonas tetramitiformis]|uniref:Uncharacterized protein n=1 Tax=Cymbomonas tetramitiformis TaxID=36881 RepID=A0AAE0GKL8_9CHLO|nr:hypothetical protein CYMTET_12256 [Cymbomonas tetramitiformis]
MVRSRGPKRRKSNHTDVVLVAQGKGLVKRTRAHPYDIAGSDENDYQVVKKIRAHRKCYGVDQYLIAWEGFDTQHGTWEPAENLLGSEADIEEFLKQKIQEAEAAEALAVASKQNRLEGGPDEDEEDGDATAGDSGEGNLEDAKNGKTKRRALVWDYFWVVKDGVRVLQIVCKLCGPNSTAIPYCGNTSNLRSHVSHVHQDAYCKMCIAEKKAAGENVGSLTSATGGGNSETSAGTIEAMLPQVSIERRDELHKMFALWIVRRRRPLKICETDTELRDIFDYIFQGAYIPPSYKLVTQKILDLSAEARIRTHAEIAAVLADCVLVSIAGDIWSEGGTSLFGILAYWFDNEFQLQERLLGAIPFSDVRHTGPEILAATKKAHSIIGVKLLHSCQEKNDLLAQTRPPKDNDTRTGWSGVFKQSAWFRVQQQEAIRMYDVDHPRKAANAAANPDGSVHMDHKLEDILWDIVNESVYILNLTTECINLLQGTDYCTSNLVLPLVGSLANKLMKTTPVKFEKAIRQISNEAVIKAREQMYQEVCRRYFNNLMEYKLEDFCVATFLDPRYKNFDFKNVDRWNKGTLTVRQAQGWARSAWQINFRPKEQDPSQVSTAVAPAQPAARAKTAKKCTVASFLNSDSEDDVPILQQGSAEQDVQEDEFEKYLALPVAKRDTDPIVWWGTNLKTLPNLGRMARQFLAAPASTAGVERAFSDCTQNNA